MKNPKLDGVITAGKMIEYLQAMIKLGKIKDTTPLIYASDEEGNSYHLSFIGPEPLLFDDTENSAIGFDDFVENNYKELKSNYKEMLRDTGRYDGMDLDEVDDGRQDFVYESMRESNDGIFACCVN